MTRESNSVAAKPDKMHYLPVRHIKRSICDGVMKNERRTDRVSVRRRETLTHPVLYSFFIAPSQMPRMMCLTTRGRILSGFCYFLMGLPVAASCNSKGCAKSCAAFVWLLCAISSTVSVFIQLHTGCLKKLFDVRLNTKI